MPSGTNHGQALDEQAIRRINDLHIAEKLEKYGTREREEEVWPKLQNLRTPISFHYRPLEL